jgi:hypothetical protein
MTASSAFSTVAHRHARGHDDWEARTVFRDAPNLDDRPGRRLAQRVDTFQRPTTDPDGTLRRLTLDTAWRLP